MRWTDSASQYNIKHKRHYWRLFGYLMAGTLLIMAPMTAQASEFSQLLVRFDRQQENTQTAAEIVFTPFSATPIDKLVLEFPSAPSFFDGGPVTLGTSALEPGVTPLPGSLSAMVSGSTLTISGISGTSAGTQYGVNILSGLQNPVSGTYAVTISSLDSGSNPIDSTVAALNVIASDQVQANATAPASDKPCDLNGDSYVNIFDLSILLTRYDTSDSTADINHDGIVDIFDLSMLLSCYEG